MQATALKHISEEDYWTLEETSPVKHEYWDGEILAMAGGTFNHARVAANLLGAAQRQLRGKPCVVVGSDLRVKIAKSKKQFNTYPDVSITCPPFQWEQKRSHVKDTLLNPRVLFEVLSPSTAEFDKAEKFDQYKLIESLTDYILIWQDRVRIEHFHREGEKWTLESYTRRADTFTLPELEITLALEEIYDGVDVPEDLRLISAVEDED